MASLVDPHHLPFGAIWEVYDQLDSWADHTQIIPMRVSLIPLDILLSILNQTTNQCR